MIPPLLTWPADDRWIIILADEIECAACDGSGTDEAACCPECGGSGEGRSWSDASLCAACRGDGTARGADCPECGGEGSIDPGSCGDKALMEAGYWLDDQGTLYLRSKT